jgi:hypothetical protein
MKNSDMASASGQAGATRIRFALISEATKII